MKQTNSLNKLILFCLIFLGVAVQAQAGRPLNTDDAGTVSAGILEVETAYEYVDQPDEENNLSVVFTTGIMNKLDIGVEVPYSFIDVQAGEDRDGISDIGVTTKWNFYTNDEDLDATLSFNYKSDNGDDDKGLGTGDSEYTILGIVSKQLKDLAIHLNVGPTIVKDGSDVFNYLVAAEWGVTERLALVSEIFGSTTFAGDFDEHPFSGLTGFTYSISDRLVFDFGVSFGISEADPDFSIVSGLTFEFGGE